ncbi:MAG: hypothetical protein AAGC60_06900 [Acidobacteriota bacterium]
MRTPLLLTAITALLAWQPTVAEACSTGSTSWSHTGSCGSYVPPSGTYAESKISSSNTFITTVDFTLSSSNVTSILAYNAGGVSGSGCSSSAYLTLDITSQPDNSDRFDGYAIYTDLPNPKKDLEDDSFWGDGFREESEVVALGTVSARSYYMKTYWDDQRTGYVSDRGAMLVQFAMSSQPWWGGDYNNCTTAAALQIYNTYLGCQGCV